ncbi:MAG: sodium:proton antiporter [Bacteroidales bacterium]
MGMLTLQNISIVTAFLLMLIGLYGALTTKNILRIIIAFDVFDSGLNLFLVALSYVNNRLAPIIDSTTGTENLSSKFVDPIPQALVLTSIVIGVGVTAVMLTYAYKMYKYKNTLNINEYKDSRW